VLELPEASGRFDRFIQADLDHGLPDEIQQEGPFDIVLAADVLEHVRDPALLLEHSRRLLVPRGTLIVSVPNFGHWYARGRTLLGAFDYDQRGLLDRGHVRFFTRRSIERELRDAGFTTTRKGVTGLPLDVLTRKGGIGKRLLRTVDRAAVAARPTLFGYQLVYHCEAPPASEVLEPRRR
jgi:SAM-dependent methyltransferase